MNRQIIFLLLISICLSLAACDIESNYAPVTEINTIEPIPKTGIYRTNSNLPIASWKWPAKGKVIRSFSSLNKGINIAGTQGEPIYAAATGKVVYCGDGLRGYGNLIIIKHNNLYLSAYAHNETVMVKEGDLVNQGQKIAEMGDTGSNKTMLHFEIRRAGKPIDPTSLLRS